MSDAAKLQIDDDWKSEAQREKERLADQVKETTTHDEDLPPADFRGLVNMLAMQAMVGLGGMRDQRGQALPPQPELAKYYIDLLDVIDVKCKGNLKEDEKKLLDTALYQLRMGYVEIMTALKNAAPAAGPARS